MPFLANIAPIVFSTRYLRNSKDPVVRDFSFSFELVVYLFKSLRIHLFIH